MPLFLGLDGGGTTTRAVVADGSGSVVGLATNGPSNWEMVGLPDAGTTIATTVDAALGQAGAERSDLTAAVFGLAGLDWPSDEARLASVISPMGLGGDRMLLNDAFIALRAGTSRPWGVVVVAGTGTVAAGRNRRGETWRTLGLGPEFGDWGSAADVAREALRAVADAYTGRGPETSLTAALCEAAGADDAAALIERASRQAAGLPGPGDAGPALEAGDPQLAPLVISEAERGDAAATDILARAGASLGGSAALVARRLEMRDEPFEVVLAGGLFQGANRTLEDAIEVAVRRESHHATLLKPNAPPVVGAVLTAMELAGIEPDAEVRGRLGGTVAAALAAVR